MKDFTINFDEIQNEIQHKILNIYVVGSVVYGTNNINSDIDLKIIVNDETEIKEKQFKILFDKYDISLYTMKEFINHLYLLEIPFLETLWLSDNLFIENVKINFDFQHFKNNPEELLSLRKSISSIQSNSWVKCKKKLLQNDYYIGLKSLFHSLRVVDFGIQIMKYNKIKNYNSLNYLYSDLTNSDIVWNWSDLSKKYKPFKNKNMSELKKLIPK